MPQLTAALRDAQRGTGPGREAGRDRTGGRTKEEGEEEGPFAERRRGPPSDAEDPSWFGTLRALPPWCSLAPAGVVWLLCQLEALLRPSLTLRGFCCRLALLGLLWVILGHCVHRLKGRQRPGRRRGAEPLWTQQQQQQIVSENRNNLQSWTSQPGTPGAHVPLTLALTDSLLLCVLQEPLSNPGVPHIQALVSRLKSVGETLEKAGVTAGVTLEEAERGSALTDRLTLLFTYLQQRTASLHALVQVQGRFEASAAEVLQGLDCLWAQLEQLHAGVTFTKEGSRGQVAVASAQTDAETLFAVVGQYGTKLESCRAHLDDTTQLLQELTWSHKHISARVRGNGGGGGESVWPELLLQSNMEQFDKVQECFGAVEQQTSTFRAHLEGLGRANGKPGPGPLAHAGVTRSSSVPQQESEPEGPPEGPPAERRNSASPSTPARSLGEALCHFPRSLRQRSAQQVSSTLERLRQSGRKK